MKFSTLAFLALTASAVCADGLEDRLSSAMETVAKTEHFSGTVLVARGGKILLARGYGLANAEHDVPNTPDTRFRIGSITKQFTATAILLLQEQGKLKVEDPIARHLPDAPKAWDKVTIHHLLTHTSGIPSYTDDPAYPKLMTQPETVDSMIARFKDKPLDFEPGTKFHYDNSGYFLLGAIIEKASGTTYEKCLEKFIFEPLGMKDTGYDHPGTVLPRRAAGYDREPNKLVNAKYLDMNQPYAAGSLYSTVLDMSKWDQVLKAEKLLSKESMIAMFTPFKNGYAYGWGVGDFQGHKTVGHGGGINGFATDFKRFPDDDLCVAVFSNVLPANPGKIADILAGVALEDKEVSQKSTNLNIVPPK